MVLAISTLSSDDELAFKNFLSQHPDIKAEVLELADMYDANGQFKEINLTVPGLPVTKAYMTWYLNKAKSSIEDGKGMTHEEVKTALKLKREQSFGSG